MPSKKPIIHFNTEQWIIDKMKVIANENSRSLAKEMEYMCKQRIKKYEEENGEINISEEMKDKPFKKQLKKEMKLLKDMQEKKVGAGETLIQSAKLGLDTFK